MNNTYFRLLLISVTVVFSMTVSNAQLLYPESYVIILDTSNHFKGSISPSIEIKTQRELYTEVNNTANMAYRFKKHSIILANKFELTRSGAETILSGGFLYAKFKTFYDNPFVLEHYAQYQWAEARGLDQKYAIGSNVRYKLYKNPKGGAFMGIGPFLEREEWNFQGVPDERLPTNTELVRTDLIKLNFYISVQQTITEKIKAEGAFYFQDGFRGLISNPRLGGSAGVSYQVTPHVSFGLQFRTAYDFAPTVPVDKLWVNTFTELEITF